MRHLLILVLCSVGLLSCEVTVDLDLKQTGPKIVIEGQVTDQPGLQFVKVTRTVDFYDTGKTPRITNAVVSVVDDLGTIFDFVHNPGADPDSAGIYIPLTPFTGEIGRVYKLNVTLDGTTYTASDYLESVISMDSLKSRVNNDERSDPKDDGKYYELLMYTKEPQDQENFYLFKFYRNDSLTFYNDTDIYFTDDELLAGSIDGYPSPVFFGVGDKGRVEIYSISREGYIYYNDLWSLLNNDAGGMFGPIPASPRTNLSNGALGFFQVSAVNVSELLIE